MKAKEFTLDLSVYEVEAPRQVIKEDKSVGVEMKSENYPIKNNLSMWLRTMGIFKCGEDIAEAVSLAKQLRDCEGDTLILDEREADILKQATNKLIALTAEGRAQLGGVLHEEAICRVINMKESGE
jgi:hypothetical protein